MEEHKLTPTLDGSFTIFSEKFQAGFHSHFGALSESQKVYIEYGLNFLSNSGQKDIRLFEIGFGSGLNACLSIQFAISHNLQLDYRSIEQYVLRQEQIDQLYELEQFHFPYYKRLFNEKKVELTKSIQFQLIHSDWLHYLIHWNPNLIYYDAFAHSSQSDMWDIKQIEKCYSSLTNQLAPAVI